MMDRKMKASAVLLVALVVGGALVMVQAQAEDASVPSTVPQQARTLYKSVVAGRWRLVRALIRNGEPATLTDVKVLTYDKGLMVLSNGLNVLVTGKWVKDGSVVAREDLLNGLVGQTITIQALKLEYMNKYTATVYFAYKVGDANAMLPWNITPKSTA
jgi:archaellum component FlaF (FlaF/FlaG flagellin family)